MFGIVPKHRKYQLPDFLSGKVTQARYEKWLKAKAAAHLKRDKKRGNAAVTNQAYKEAIHNAVIGSRGLDHYTGEWLDWTQIGQYDNAESKAKRRKYKTEFALLPTIDHVGDGLGEPDFRVCAWRTNDAKSDLSDKDFSELCRRVADHFGRGDA